MTNNSRGTFPLAGILDDEYARILDNFTLVKTVVYKKKRIWNIYVNAGTYIDHEKIQLLEKHISAKFPQLAGIRFIVTYGDNGSEILEGNFSRIWIIICKLVKEELPSLNGWIDHCTPSLSGNTLKITINHPVALELFRVRKADQLIEKWISETFNCRIKVSIELSEEFDEWTDEDYFIEQEKENSILIKNIIRTSAASSPDAGLSNKDKPGKAVVVHGKQIQETPVSIESIQESFDAVTVEGTVFAIEKRALNGNKALFSLDITDYTDSVTVKLFCSQSKASDIEKKIQEGCWVRVRGNCRYDTYQREEVLMANDVMLIPPKTRLDKCEEKRVELHLHTQMSALDAVSPAFSLVERAARWGHPAVAITDHGVIQAYPEAYEAGKRYGIKIIYGVEAYLINDIKPIVQNPNHNDFNQAFVVLDIETTGLDPRYNELTEIGAVKIVNREVVDTFHCFVNPQTPIPREITKLTGINDEMVKDAPVIEEVLPQLIDFLGDAVLVAHNAPFDLGFIKEKCKRINIEIKNGILDTLMLSRELLKDIKRHSLNYVAEYLGVPMARHHRALDDARTTGEILMRLLDSLESRGVHRLDLINSYFGHVSNLNALESYHAVILAKNQEGLTNLYRIISKSHLDYYYRRPRIPKSLLASNRNGLIIGSGCEAGELFQAILKGESDKDLTEIAQFYDYLEIQPLCNNEHLLRDMSLKDIDELKDINRRIVEIGDKLGKPVVATGDVHFLDPHDEYYRRILMSGQGYQDAEKQAPLYFKTTDEMLEEFRYLGEQKAREVVIYSPNEIAASIDDIKPIPEELYSPEIPESEEEIVKLTMDKAASIYGDPLPPVVEERLKKELDTIVNNRYSALYWLAHKLVKKSLEDGYLVGSRGSVGSSLVATMTGITEVNPLPPHYVCPKCKNSDFDVDVSKYGCGIDLPDKSCPRCGTMYNKEGFDIPFEVFLGFNGEKVPDIDLNFSGEYQSAAHRYTEELLGEGKVFRAGTIATIAEKTAFGFVKNYLDEHDKSARNAEIKRLVKGCTGIKRTTGQHPGGVMIVPQNQDIHRFTPIQYPADDRSSGVITTHFDYNSISSRLVKLDILGHDDPTVIRMLEDITGVDVKDVPLGEKNTMKLFSSTEPLGISQEDIDCGVGTFGIPEFGTRFVRQMLNETKPTAFSELIRISGLSHGTDVWLNNAQELIKNGTAQLSEVISTRDDIMVYLMYKGVDPIISFKIMEDVRKGKGLTPEYEKKMKEKEVPQWFIDSCKKIKYMFPKAHAVAYVIMAFRIAYFKVYYPEAFYATYFTVRADDFDAGTILEGKAAILQRIKELESKGNTLSVREKNLLSIYEVALEMYVRGINLLPPDLYKSDSVRFIVTRDGIRIPFSALQGVGASAANSIVEARKSGSFVSIEDFREKTKVSKTVIEILREHGCFRDMPETSQISFF